MSNIVDPAVARKLRIHSQEVLVERPICGWRLHWVDHMHEPEGGEDGVGCERIGVEELRNHMSALYSRGGVPVAWDDMNKVFLDPAAANKSPEQKK